MQISKVSFVLSLAGAAALQLHAQSASPELQGKALELLRQTISQERQAGSPSNSKPVQDKTAKTTTTKKTQPAAKTETSTGVSQSMTATKATAAPAATPIQPTGPKTKQQRLADLLELYKADKLTPAQYQAERAKIMAEP
jgi:hypothetical protein